MTSDLYFRSLKTEDLIDMYLTFLDAFSDYPIEFRLTKDQFVKKFVKKLSISFDLSVGAFDVDALVGFIFTSVKNYQGKLTAYNGGTGVRPSYRNQKITYKLYDYLIPQLIKNKVKQCVLEVLTTNEKAIKAYESVGFKKATILRCFKLSTNQKIKSTPSNSLELFKVKNANWGLYQNFKDTSPSFLDSDEVVDDNADIEHIIEAKINGACVGYLIFQPSAGRIGQFAVDNKYRHQGVASALLNYAWNENEQKALTILNVNEIAYGLISYLHYVGFENQIDQYEMFLPLD